MDIRALLFKFRSYTPIPLLLAILLLANPTPASLIFGFIVAVLGESLRLWGVRHAGGATRTTGSVGAGAVLITHGPFAFVRNPLYLGNFLLSLGLCLMSNAWMPWMLFVFIALFAWQYSMIISLEEEHLQQRFGEVYTNYLKNVPRFLPRLTPFQKQNVQVMPLQRALKIESNTLLSFTAVSLAIFLIWKF